MGLAAARTKQRFGLDPRNTAWSNNTSRFGHQYLEKLGWKPGSGLGMMSDATTTHIKVSIKDDNLGLGAKLKKKDKQDEFDSGECTGLDVFQRLLGRLNGNEETISKELDRQKTENIINGKWGIHFVKGEVLSSTWDAETKQLISYAMVKKRKADDSDNSEDEHKKIKSSKDKSSKKGKDSNGITRDEMLKPRATAASVPDAVTTRLSVRSKWIKQKRAAVMDAKALNEIFMVKDS
ncbi:telomerase inhibitor [Kluyveromyces marxianus]|nr:telomerase inhibitor [Kluyveromyces marxianus]KAG0683873.1 telomerase inhibitor [Kluyveromyces marxianus]